MSSDLVPEAVGQTVEMIYLGQKIGTDTAEILPGDFAIHGPFNWPPASIAITEGLFHLVLTSDKTCSVKASYPGLLQDEIDAPEAEYFTLLIGARPQFNITTPNGDRLVFGTTGPFGDPERVTGYQLGIQPTNQHGLTFNFRVV